jgi:hypothetical protein
MKDFNRLIQWGFEGLAVGAICLGVSVLSDISKSVNDINAKIVLVIERTDVHTKMLESHESRLRDLEIRRR